MLLGALGVQLEQAREDLVADIVGPTVAPVLLLAALARGLAIVLLFLVVEKKLASRLDVSPGVGIKDGAIHSSVEIPKRDDVRIGFLGVMEPRVDRRRSDT